MNPDLDLADLFAAPQLTTDSDGRHWDAAGREYRAVDVDGELAYEPVGSAGVHDGMVAA